MKEEKSIFFHPGIYKFQWPYIMNNFVTDDQGEVRVYNCNVEIRVGQEDDMNDGKLVTVVISGTAATPGVQPVITDIATKVRLSFFDSIFIEKHWEKSIVPEHRIRWIEQNLFSLNSNTVEDEIFEVTMNWDEKRHIYTSPSWTTSKVKYMVTSRDN
ncbi:hypothetical protein [Paenibacillus sp. MMO-177]|uniref:hypothetical protein n=1 Tax=Paenibacillus sp. MMO-177 TaxID=3081289 RepID=UPI0030178A17